MRVNASLPSYKQLEVELSPNKTAKDLKAIICKKLGIEPELTRLLARKNSARPYADVEDKRNGNC